MWATLAALLYFTTIAPQYQNLATKAQEILGWNWQSELPGWHIVYGHSVFNTLSDANGERRVIRVWVRENQTPIKTAAVIAHELGHAFDWDRLGNERRAEWMAIRHMPRSTKWYPPCFCTDYAFGAGDFAEAVAWTLIGPEARWKSKLGKPPTEAQQAIIRGWLGIK